METLTRLCELIFFEFAFPYDNDLPPFIFELGGYALIARFVAGKFLLPILDVAFGGGGILAVFVMVPEAAMHENGDLAAGKRDIRMSDAFLPVAAISGPPGIAQHVANHKLGFGVDAFVRDHRIMYCFSNHYDHDTASIQVRPRLHARFADGILWSSLYANCIREAAHV